MTVKSFTVFHKDKEARTALGRGFVVGKQPQITKYQYQGFLPNSKTPALITESKVVLKYEVLWEGAREISPSLHLSTDLEWEMLTDELLAYQMADNEDDEQIENEDANADANIDMEAGGENSEEVSETGITLGNPIADFNSNVNNDNIATI